MIQQFSNFLIPVPIQSAVLPVYLGWEKPIFTHKI